MAIRPHLSTFRAALELLPSKTRRRAIVDFYAHAPEEDQLSLLSSLTKTEAGAVLRELGISQDGDVAVLSFDMIYAMQVFISPKGYAERPTPLCPSAVMSNEAKITVMAGRVKRGEHLFHPSDARQRSLFMQHQDRGGRVARRRKNGTTYEGELRRM